MISSYSLENRRVNVPIFAAAILETGIAESLILAMTEQLMLLDCLAADEGMSPH